MASFDELRGVADALERINSVSDAEIVRRGASDLNEAVRLLSRAVQYVPDGLDGFIREIGDFVLRIDG